MPPRSELLTVPRRPEFSDYLHPEFTKRIRPGSVKTLFELGGHDGADTLQLAEAFAADVHAFECHPGLLPQARQRCASHPRIRLVEQAVWDTDGRIPFYPMVRTIEQGRDIENVGASSCFRAGTGYHRLYEQEEIEVPSLRLDTYCTQAGIDRIDLICMDIQGAALHALRGLGRWLRGVRYLVAEIEERPIYEGQDLFPETNAFLEEAGFRAEVRVLRDEWFSDYFYVNRNTENVLTRIWRGGLALAGRR